MTPNVAGALVQIQDGAIRLELPVGKGELAVRHVLDVSALHGKRVRLRARARTSAPTSTAMLSASVVPPTGTPSYADVATSRTVNTPGWSVLDTVIDVASDAATAELSVVHRGGGDAWFDDVEVTIVGPAPRSLTTPLSDDQLSHLITLTRAYGYVRFLHPSDESAACDWDAFLPDAISRILRIPDGASIRDELREVFSRVAPTVAFVATSESKPLELPARGNATHLARWRHLGLQSSSMYKSVREGRDEDTFEVERSVVVTLPNVKSCGSAKVDARFRAGTVGDVALFVATVRPGAPPADTQETVSAGTRDLAVKAAVPADTQQLRVGVRMAGRATVTLESLSLACEAAKPIPVDITADWEGNGDSAAYRWSVDHCDTGRCGTLARIPLATELVPERDVVDIDVGSGVRMKMPLAVWATADHTLPTAESVVVQRNATIRDRSTRLAAVAATWATLRLFYPYFKDEGIDWDAALPGALRAAATARSPDELHDVLSRLVAALRDDHARVTHAAMPNDGVVPLALRRFGNTLVVVGGLPQYLEDVPVGTEVLAIDGTPALDAYDRVYERVSAATQGWHDYATPFYLTLGRAGTFRSLRTRRRDGKESVVALPLVSRDLYDSAVREPRPKTGAELAAGVFYVDLEGISDSTWQGVLPTLQKARAIIFDLRGYTTSTGRKTLSYLSDHELRSPEWQIPVIADGANPTFETSHWNVFPASAQLTAPVVVLIDGRSASAVETILQIIRDAKLAYMVGETSGGTNGNTNSFDVPGDFSVRFTGMRVGAADGSTIQGRGITPDKLVRPTLEGVRSGRDEILEAGVAEAQRLAKD